jgi:hypothetical protein
MADDADDGADHDDDDGDDTRQGLSSPPPSTPCHKAALSTILHLLLISTISTSVVDGA